MKNTPLPVSFGFLFFLGLAESLALVVPSVAIIWSLHLLGLQASLFFFFVFCFENLILASFAWLLARGSNWFNTPLAIKSLILVNSQHYGFLLGALIGMRFFGPLGALFIIVLLFVLGMFVSIRLGDAIVVRLQAANPVVFR